MGELGKRVAVLGLGISGFQSALFLKEKGFDVFASELKDSIETLQHASQLERVGAEVEVGGHTLVRILEADWALLSPGISPFSEIARKIQEHRLPIYSEIEVASRFSRTPFVVGVTGTAGKTTLATLLKLVFEKKGHKVHCLGNIGAPWIGHLERIQPRDWVVLELSSFQLHFSERFKPHVGILLNISPNHLDWHGTLEHYVQAKLNLFKNQTSEDHAFFRIRDQEIYFPNFRPKAKTYDFGQSTRYPPNEEILIRLGRIFDYPESLVRDVLASFTGIEHRLEHVARVHDVDFVNDSKCTTPLSLAWALEKYKDRTVILLAGGRAKSDDFSDLRDLVHRKVRAAILLGEAARTMAKAWEGVCPVTLSSSLEEALSQAARLSQPHDTVLLSPACASFDMFKNYEERGHQFKDQVLKYSLESLKTC